MDGNGRRWSVRGLLAVSGLGVLLGACGSGATTQIGPTAALLAPGYLATSGQEVDFIQWTRQGNSFSGSFDAVYITGSPPSANTQPKQGTASGSIDGSRVSVNVNGPAPDFGSLSNGTLIINFPQQDGTLVATTFRPGTADDYNRAVLSLKDQVALANAAELRREQAAAQAQQQQEAPPAPGQSSQVTTNQPIYLRSQAVLGAQQLVLIPSGATVTEQCADRNGQSVGPSNDRLWAQVTYNGLTGFIPEQNTAGNEVFSGSGPSPSDCP